MAMMKRVVITGMDDVAVEDVRATLEPKGYQVIRTGSTRETLAHIYAQRPDLVILEKGVPNSAHDVGEACGLIREVSESRSSPSWAKKRRRTN